MCKGGYDNRYSVISQGLCSGCSHPPLGPELSFPQLWGSLLYDHSSVTVGTVLGWRELPLPCYSPFPGASCIQSLVDVGCRGPDPLPSYGTILKGHGGFTASWEISYWPLSRLSSLVCVNLSQVLFPKAFPNQHSVHAPVCQNLLAK